MINKYKGVLVYFELVLLYSFIFILIFGYNNFDIHYTDWCLVEYKHTNPLDINENYLNFFAFLNDSAPIPYCDSILYPFKCSLFYIDYIPIIAILIKIFHKYIIHSSELINIQYAWWFGVFSFILQGLVSYKIIKKITNTNILNATLCSIFFIIAPPLLLRFPFHFALSAQFIILISFFPFIYTFSKKQLLMFYFGISILCCGITPVFVPFICINFFAYIIYKLIKKQEIIFNLALIPVFLIGIYLSLLCYGAFNTDLYFNGYGWGHFSANLNTFFNPVNIYELFSSKLFPFLNKLKLYSFQQNEGFAYLGGGIIVLLLLSFIILIKNIKSIIPFIKKYKVEILIFLIVYCTILFLAVSTTITLGDKKVIEFNLPQKIVKIASVFRSSGRYIWENFYLVYLLIFIFLIKNISNKKVTFILSLCLILQIYDLFPAFSVLHNEYTKKTTYKNELNTNENWNKVTKDRKNIIMFDYFPFFNLDINEWAIRNHYNSNNLQVSRDLDYNKFYNFLFERYNNPKEEDIYVFYPEDIEYINTETKLQNCYSVTNKYIACTQQPIEGLIGLQAEISTNKDETHNYRNYKYLMEESKLR
ncbi:hypothetical protein IJ182_03280 [bacterium]|nr:hypothetical protein [bacterium]